MFQDTQSNHPAVAIISLNKSQHANVTRLEKKFCCMCQLKSVVSGCLECCAEKESEVLPGSIRRPDVLGLNPERRLGISPG